MNIRIYNTLHHTGVALALALLLLIFYGLPHPVCAETQVVPVSFDHNHSIWDKLLQRFVSVNRSQSALDYHGLQLASGDLNNYLKLITEVKRSEYDLFTRQQKLAFMINAYNAFTVQLVLKDYPVRSIKDIGGWITGPWKHRFFSLFGKKRHLDFIEHEVIRKDFQVPEIHFALVCAARSCPPLRPEAYTGEDLNHQLDAAAQNFLSDPERNFYDPEKHTLHLSKIFNWFEDDFLVNAKSIQTYVASRMSSVPGGSNINSAPIFYLSYDWTLNDIAR